MKPEHFSIFITASSVSFLAVRAVMADRFRNPLTAKYVLIGGIMPWFTIGLLFGWLPEWPILAFFAFSGLFGGGLIFFAALLRYWLGPRFDGWEKAAGAMVAAVLAALGFYIATVAGFHLVGH